MLLGVHKKTHQKQNGQHLSGFKDSTAVFLLFIAQKVLVLGHNKFVMHSTILGPFRRSLKLSARAAIFRANYWKLTLHTPEYLLQLKGNNDIWEIIEIVNTVTLYSIVPGVEIGLLGQSMLGSDQNLLVPGMIYPPVSIT